MKQHESKDCGAACLVSLARYHGLEASVAQVSFLASSDHRGASALGLVQAAARIGLTARGIRLPPEAAGSIPTPSVAHLSMAGRLHYVTVYDVTPRGVVVMDPQHGTVRELSHREFREMWSGVLIVAAPAEAAAAGERRAPGPGRLRRLAGRYGLPLSGVAVAAAGHAVLGIAAAVQVQQAVDGVLATGDVGSLAAPGLTVLALLALQFCLALHLRITLADVGRRLGMDLIVGYYRHIFALPQRFLSGRASGDVLRRVGDVERVRGFVSTFLSGLLLGALAAVASLGLAAWYSGGLALLLAAVLLAYGLLHVVTGRLDRRNREGFVAGSVGAQSWILESAEASATIRQLGLEAYAAGQTEERMGRCFRSIERMERTELGSATGVELLARIGVVLCLWVGGGMVLEGTITAGMLLALLFALFPVTGSAAALEPGLRELSAAREAAARLFEVMELEPPRRSEGGAALPVPAGDIVFRDVSFRYGAGRPVLRDLSFTIPAGKITAVVGERGAGKSTLVSLLHRIESPDAGTIRIGGVDLDGLAVPSLRSRIAVVPAAPHLFPGTIAGNIAPGEASPDPARLAGAVDRAGVAQLARTLPFGLETPVGENGHALAEAQRQRIGLARALYRQPALLVLDEATSALDAAGQREIQALLEELRDQGVTVVTLSARPTAAVRADKVVVLRNGTVAEEGSHTDLLRARSAYHALWQEQPGTGDLPSADLSLDPHHAGPADAEAAPMVVTAGPPFSTALPIGAPQ